MASPTDILLPRTLPFPITVVDLHAREAEDVKRGTRLLSYSFRNKSQGVSTAASTSNASQLSFGTWDAPVDGKVTRWNIRKGQTLDAATARRQPVVLLEEPCTHGLQMGGLCALCGKDMTALDYTGYSDSARANIQMTHLAGGPTVSLEEARRLENETAERLLKNRKLSLIVDLDQTIVHATVDPTVGEWIAQGQAWEEYQARKPSESTTPEPDAPPEPNANWEALRDVCKFTLAHDGPHLGHRHPWKGKEREDEHGCLYYIKPRPGLQAFLEAISQKYEMHVYTMGTRAYAEKVCAAIDPDGRMFGRRILSRDESGSLTAKSLERLFPCDTSMVVIIDDRSDVWDRSPNLVEVVRYDFFVGIGDINSTFLPPKIDPRLRIPAGTPTIERKPTGPQQPTATPDEEEEKEDLEDALLSKQEELLEAQIEERPLAKRQHDLEEHPELATNGNGTHRESTPSTKVALLRNDDTELARLQHILSDVHERFFKLYDKRRPSDDSRIHKTPSIPYDVRKIIGAIKSQTFAGMHFLFSSLIPLEEKPEQSPIWKQAQEFGAICHSEVSPRLTHVITAKRSTAKVDAARRRGEAHIVWVQWFIDSTSVWHAQDVRPYLVDPSAADKLRAQRSASSVSAGAEDAAQDEDEDEDDAMGAGLAQPDSELATVTVDWADLRAEVDAELGDTEDDDDGDEDFDGASAGWRTPSRRSVSGGSTPRGRKRGRSVDSDGSVEGKRVKRSGSLLRTFTTAEDLDETGSMNGSPLKQTGSAGDTEEDDEGGEEEEEEDWDVDFLAQELGVEDAS